MVRKRKEEKKNKGGKERRRVSFQIPEKQLESDSDDAPAVNISVHEGDDSDGGAVDVVDEDVETMDTDGEEDGESSSGGSDVDEEASEEEPQPTITPTAASSDGDEEDASDSEIGESESEASEQSDEDGDSGDDSGECKSSGSESSGSESSDDSDEEGDEAKKAHRKAPSPISSFGEMSLDPRVERAIERLGWRKPTPVQSAVIPAALSGRDVLVSAPTGSGKTGAYAVPIVQHLCQSKRGEKSGTRVVVLVPTRELVRQVTTVFKMVCKYVDGVHVAGIANRNNSKNHMRKDSKGSKDDQALEQSAFSRCADIMVGTPASILSATGKDEKNVLSDVDFVVVDEADLVLSYGYEDDARAALAKIPTTAQSMLLSATLDAEGMDNFKKVILRRPLTIKVTADDNENQNDDPSGGASHYFARLKNHKDRYLVTYAMLRLNVICGKVLIFVNHVNSAFRLKLFLDQFKVKSAVLNSELPANSRMHCVDQFNAGIFDILIATDEAKRDDATEDKKDKAKGKKGEKKKRKRVDRDEEFGLSRGVDFRDVAAVFNFDVPDNKTNYAHRAGRTARAGRSGTVLSLVCTDKEVKAVWNIGRSMGIQIGPLAFRMDQIEAFRYRVEDSLRMVTDAAVNAARLADVQREMMNSEQLQDYFEDNPQDLDALRHNLSLAKNIPEHLGHIPSYLLPPGLRGTVANEPTGPRYRTKRRRGKYPGKDKSGEDPLKSFSNKRVGGSSRNRFQNKHGIKKRAKSDGGQLLKRRRRSFKMR